MAASSSRSASLRSERISFIFCVVTSPMPSARSLPRKASSFPTEMPRDLHRDLRLAPPAHLREPGRRLADHALPHNARRARAAVPSVAKTSSYTRSPRRKGQPWEEGGASPCSVGTLPPITWSPFAAAASAAAKSSSKLVSSIIGEVVAAIGAKSESELRTRPRLDESAPAPPVGCRRSIM